jgi:outer membrane protein with beta-barrel domain
MRHSPLGTVARAVAAFALVTVAGQSAAAQAKASGGGFGVGYTDLGVVVGLGGIGSASASFGARAEHAIKALPDMGNGILGIEAGFDYYSWSNTFFSYKYIPIGVTANYHFKLDEPKIDPFVGLGLGYQVITCSYSGSGLNGCSNSALYFIGRVGARYFFQPNLAGYVDAGAGAATFNVGVTFKM